MIYSFLKKLFDMFFSVIALIIALPLFLVFSILIKRCSPGPVFYLGNRVGRNGRIFRMYKFRSMIVNADKIGGPSTSADDFRLTIVGKFLRKHNLDELPQLINILKGEMSFVGPRPEVPSEVETYSQEDKDVILSVKPGLTDLATLADIHEEEILRGAENPHEAYRRLIKPQKLRLAKEYVKTRSFWLDFKILIKTFLLAVK